MEREAEYQGASINQLPTYLLYIRVTQLEMISTLESRLQRKSLSGLKMMGGLF